MFFYFWWCETFPEKSLQRVLCTQELKQRREKSHWQAERVLLPGSFARWHRWARGLEKSQGAINRFCTKNAFSAVSRISHLHRLKLSAPWTRLHLFGVIVTYSMTVPCQRILFFQMTVFHAISITVLWRRRAAEGTCQRAMQRCLNSKRLTNLGNQ